MTDTLTDLAICVAPFLIVGFCLFFDATLGRWFAAARKRDRDCRDAGVL